MNMRATRRLLTLALVLVVTGCGDDDTTVTPPIDAPVVTPPDAAPPAATVALTTAGGLGERLVDKDGKTLYFYGNDIASSNASACLAGTNCVTTWPVFDVQSPIVGTGLTAADFGRFDRGAGVFQATWKGRPLYYYSMDTAATDTKGDKVGGRWFVARTYNLYVGLPAPATPPTVVTPLGVAAGVMNAPFFTNGAGRTLYVHKGDTRGVVGGALPVATGPLATWPAWIAPANLANLVLPSTITAADLTSFTNGAVQQFAYKGWPVYFFGADANPGQVAGAAIAPPWYTVNIAWDGAVIP